MMAEEGIVVQGRDAPRRPELWGLEDVARELGISPDLAAQWRRRGRLPEPDWVISGRPIWLAERVRAWAARRRDTGPGP